LGHFLLRDATHYAERGYAMARCLSVRLSVCDVEVFRGYIGWNSILRVAFCPVAFCPVALCPEFWPIAVKLSPHHDLCRFSANVPAAACMVTRLTRFIGGWPRCLCAISVSATALSCT